MVLLKINLRTCIIGWPLLAWPWAKRSRMIKMLMQNTTYILFQCSKTKKWEKRLNLVPTQIATWWLFRYDTQKNIKMFDLRQRALLKLQWACIFVYRGSVDPIEVSCKMTWQTINTARLIGRYNYFSRFSDNFIKKKLLLLFRFINEV